MVALTTNEWAFVGLLIACYVAICFRTAFRMARSGRSLWKWLLITIFCTSIPATVILMREQIRRAHPGRRRGDPPAGPPDARPFRCPQCSKLIRPADLDHSGGVAVCPHCGLPVDNTEVG